jgi:hypothetical protein
MRSLHGFVCSVRGTFGTVQREYRTEDGVDMTVIKWGPMGWLTPVRRDDLIYLLSHFESEAKKEAIRYLASRKEHG